MNQTLNKGKKHDIDDDDRDVMLNIIVCKMNE